ncbi:MAG TPA: hypothetical protein VFQ65_32490 [Kofleriaceae bacterium]|nr:hypothetical protein [Kofleriaceae bacterium]
MVTSEAAVPVEHLTWNEICGRYPDQWVALADIAWVNSTDFTFTRAEVIATFAERKAATPKMKELHAANRRSVGCFWTGKLIKGDIDPLWHARR